MAGHLSALRECDRTPYTLPVCDWSCASIGPQPMPPPKRPRREPTDDWEQLRLFVGWPEQETYEMLRPIVLFGQPSSARARIVGVSERTLDRKADRFDAEGMASLFPREERSADDRRLLPSDIRYRIL